MNRKLKDFIKYKKRLRGAEVAKAIGWNEPALSKYLNGWTELPEPYRVPLIEYLELSEKHFERLNEEEKETDID